MATETHTAGGANPDREADGTVRSIVTVALREGTLLVVAVAWTAFWLNVARLHLAAVGAVDGDLADAAFVAATMVLPAVALYGWHLWARSPVLDPRGPTDGNALDSVTNG